MRVKRLEIQGFKSFKDKTVIHFDHGITGIVGPNGCGKSNIVDAFFWVMGEQSYKHMRGSGSDDLIFNGSSKYAPLGIAEATLVLENTVAIDAPDGATVQDIPIHLRSKEVSVTRRLYRGGEGEYLINGVTARLKDIQELFMDTGVGAKGYSVIEQGQIGKIVNAKPEERRLLIEEAAGIAKYKARKKESLRKMEATQANLSRLNDVIAEIERSLGSLERQAQKARQYKKIKEELLDKEMTWGRRKIRVLKQRLEQLQMQKTALEAELVGLRAELQISENSIEIDRTEQVTDTKIAEDLQARIQQFSDDLTHEKSALDLSMRRRGDLASQLEALETEKRELAASTEVESTRLREREDEASRSDEVFSAASTRAQETDARVRVLRSEADQLRKELDAAKRELLDGITSSSELVAKAAALRGRMDSAREKKQRLVAQADEQAVRLDLQKEERNQAQGRAVEIRSRRDSSIQERSALGERIREYEMALKSAKAEFDSSHRELTQLRSKLESLEELSQAHEGFADGPRAALDWAKEKGAKDRMVSLAEAMTVEPGFEPALEGWFENRLESLISSDSALAIDVIQDIASQKKGRVAIQLTDAGVIELPVAEASEIQAALSSAGFEVLGALEHKVRVSGAYGEKIRERASQAIARVMVVRSFEPMANFLRSGGALKLADWSVVSADGAALGCDGILRGGFREADGGASLLRRKNAIAELMTQVQASEARNTQAQATHESAQSALEEAIRHKEEIQSALVSLEVEVAALERDVHQMGRAIADGERQHSILEVERATLRDEIESSERESASVDEALAQIAASRGDIDGRIMSGESALYAKDLELRDAETQLSALRVEEASLRERATSLKREIESSRALIADRERRMNEIVRTLERASRERDEFTGGEPEMKAKIEQLIRQVAEAKDAYSLVRDRLEQNSAKTNALIEKIKQLHKSGDQKTAEANQIALDLEKVTLEISFTTKDLEDKYGPGCLDQPAVSPIQEEMEAPVVTVEMTAEEEQALSEEVEHLRERIRRLGEVNPNAVEEYEELKKRYDYLTGEKADLEKSIENLEDAIEHINKTSEERFKRAFEAISNRFERLFPVIFGGGQASLSLVYPEGSTDILEAGVDIFASPPGKKVVNITLLSGGEKALTAVSLIFAIFLVKPSPFCVLDEVDAPLDDANIGKFNALLKEMSAKSQFILITHNKKTMELNDTLYGVTMEEPGVSKMVSIQML